MSVTYFIDTSALFKRYIPEEGSSQVDRLIDENTPVFISNLTRVEVASNLRRLLSVDGLIDQAQYAAAWAAFSLDIVSGKIEVVGTTPAIVEGAISLLADAYLTPVDALQVSTALSMGAGTTVICSDQKLNKVLSELGVQCIDPAHRPPA